MTSKLFPKSEASLHKKTRESPEIVVAINYCVMILFKVDLKS